MKQLICISHTPWSKTPTRTQQLLTRLKGVSILFFELSEETCRRSSGRRVRPNITVYPLPPSAVRQLGQPILNRRALHHLHRTLSKLLHKHRFYEPTIWLNSPHLFALSDQLPHRGLIYDCDREWDELPLDWESELALRADVIFAASKGLAQRLSPCCDNIAIIPNGVNYPLFSNDCTELPPLSLDPSEPLLVRTGRVTADLDLIPLLHAASAHPEWSFLLVGAVSPEVRPLLAPVPNITLVGHVPMVELPDFLCHADVQFDLLSRRKAGSDLLPARLYEYLAVGKPIVMMLTPEQIEPFPDVTYTATGANTFLRACEKALQEDSERLRDRRRAYARAAQWSQRAAEIQQILETAALL